MKLHWNIAPECISVVILGIIWVYSHRGSHIPSLKNQLFQGCFFVTFCAMTTNIISTVMIQNYTSVPMWMIWFDTTIYFILTPMMGLVYFLYSTSVIFTDVKSLRQVIGLGSIPGICYVVLVLSNIFNKSLFDISLENGYTQGPLILVTYIVFYAYCVASMALVIYKKNMLDRQIYHILATFPAIAVIVIVIQQMYPNVILTGSAATCALLIIYLHLQNKQITMDYLTDVPNRQELLAMITLYIRRYTTRPFTLLVVSLRDFKHINNTYGQQTGDAFLKAVAQYLCSVTPPGSVYRFNGDEFAILLGDYNPEKTHALIKCVLDRMAFPWQSKDYHYVMSAVIGIITYPKSSTTLEGIVNAIEYAISKAKTGKYGSICYCDDKMLEELKRKDQIIQILKDKLADHSFELYYQPIVVTDTGCFQYAESLMRMNDTLLGPIYPSEFIPIAEETGLIIDITYEILDKACKFINKLLAAGVDLKAVHVNFSAIQLSEQNLTKKVQTIIQSNGTPPSAIKIEITESTIVKDAKLITEFAKDMERLGIRMGLDDFGTGYSNIATVLNIPFSTVKLDKSLLWTSMEHQQSAIATRNLTRTFKELGLTVIAEGVENADQDRFIKDCGIDQIQGFYYARPMPESEAFNFFLENQCSQEIG